MIAKSSLYLILLIGFGVLIATILIYRPDDSSINPSTITVSNSEEIDPRKEQKSNGRPIKEAILTIEPKNTLEPDVTNSIDAFEMTNNSYDEESGEKNEAIIGEKISLMSRYQSEDVDINWAYDQQAEIMLSLQEFSVSNPDLILKSVECRSTICRIELFSYNETGRINYTSMKNLVEYIPWASEFTTKMSDQGSSAIMFVKRNVETTFN